jgi:hypothetical protein
MMQDNATHRCPQHPNKFDCPDNLIDYRAKTNYYGIIIHDGGSSSIQIQYCPWCGKALGVGGTP